MKTMKDFEVTKKLLVKRKRKSPSPNLMDNDFKKREEKVSSSLSSTYGVLGIGNLGTKIMISLIKKRRKVYIWNRTAKKCEDVVEDLSREARCYVEICHIPSLVMQRSEIIFNCISDCHGSTAIIRDNLTSELAPENFMLGKGLIDMSGIDPDGHRTVNHLVTNKGGKYLEVRLQISNELFGGGYLFLIGGDKDLYTSCKTCFECLGGTPIYLGEKIG